MSLSRNGLEIKIISSQETHDIRQKVLWPHIQDCNYSLDIDHNTNTFHLGTIFNKKIISIAKERLTITDDNCLTLKY